MHTFNPFFAFFSIECSFVVAYGENGKPVVSKSNTKKKKKKNGDDMDDGAGEEEEEEGDGA